MNIIEHPHQAYAQINYWRTSNLRIGLVPTMGALHAGHLSLVHRSRRDCDVTVVSIFVNPTQFGPNEDFSRYPRTFEADCQLLREAGADLLFAPTMDQLYPAGYSCYVDPPAVAQPLEGQFRPSHFRGVATVVLKLFQIIPATIGYFGRKDYQQLQVIRKMVEDFNVPIRVEGCPTIREPDGLAMSSRNRYLSAEQRRAALSLWRALSSAQSLVQTGERSVERIEARMHQTLFDEGADAVDYACIVDGDSLQPLVEVSQSAVALIAAKVGSTRLIDNLDLEPPAT
jgi:pantoate--beta-alanine ligase